MKIIEIIYGGEPGDEFTTSWIAKKVFNPEDSRDIKNLDSKVRARLDKMCEYGIVDVDGNGTKTYRLRKDNVIYGVGSIDVFTEFEGETEEYEFDVEGLLFVQNDKGFHVYGFIPHKDDSQQ